MPNAAELAGQIAEYDKNKVTSVDAMNEALKQYGVPEIRQTVSGLRTTLANTQNAYNAVDPSVTGRTQGSLVTEAQRQKQVSNERAPIAGQISDQGRMLGDNEKTLQDALGQANTTATNRVNDYVRGREALQSQYDTTYRAEKDAADRAEAIRQFNESQATSRGSASYGGGGGSAKAPTKADVSAHIVSAFTSPQNRGKDGYVGNGTWAAALNDWQAIGGSVREFYHLYDRFVNPKFKTSYAGWAQR